MPLPSSRAGLVSVVVGIIILAAKFGAYFLTGSQAILSDALEGIVNVVAAAAAYGILILSNRPADRNHPYGHGKAEYFSASFEGGLISFAALLIMIAAVHALVAGHTLADLGMGLVITTLAGCGNLLLGLYLLRAGRINQSTALVASGKHVLSDFWTTVATVLGLIVIQITGITAFDSVIAFGIGALLAWTGYKIVRQALGALLDEEDEGILQALSDACDKVRTPGIIKVHYVRVMRSGAYHFVDAHVVVPEFWEVRKAHDDINTFASKLIDAHTHKGEIHFHMDPCRQAHCSQCDLGGCPIRKSEFAKLSPYSIESITAKKAVIESQK